MGGQLAPGQLLDQGLQGKVKYTSHYWCIEPWLAELIYDKYGRLAQLSRVHLFYVLAWLKNYPFKSVLPRFGPRHLRIIGKHAAWAHVRVGLCRLSEVMAEIDMCHLRHENNSVPHFPFTM